MAGPKVCLKRKTATSSSTTYRCKYDDGPLGWTSARGPVIVSFWIDRSRPEQCCSDADLGDRLVGQDHEICRTSRARGARGNAYRADAGGIADLSACRRLIGQSTAKVGRGGIRERPGELHSRDLARHSLKRSSVSSNGTILCGGLSSSSSRRGLRHGGHCSFIWPRDPDMI